MKKNTPTVPAFIVAMAFIAACSSTNEFDHTSHLDAGPQVTGTVTGVRTGTNTVVTTGTGTGQKTGTGVVTGTGTGVGTGTGAVTGTGTGVNTGANTATNTGTGTGTNPAPTLVTLVLSSPSATVAVGATVAIVAKAYYSDSSSVDVTAKATWAVTPPTTATIAAGVITGVAAGTASVSASFEGKSDLLPITVTAVEVKLSAITVTAAAASVEIGTTVALSAQGTYSDGSKADITALVAWSSSNPALATVSATGVATGVAAGAVSIKASLQGKEGAATITVTAPSATLASIAVSAPKASVDVGATLALVATGTYSDGSKKDITASATWASSLPANATVSAAGVVTGVKEGSATITATAAGKQGSVALTVTVPLAVASVAVTAAATTVTVGGKVQLTANEVYTDNSKKDVTKTATWSSGTPAVATVDANGQVTAVKAGTVVITATSGSKSGSVTLTVSDVPLSTIDVTPATASIPAGTTQKFTATGTFADGSKRDITAEVSWTSNAPTVATISGAAASAGVATAKATGVSTITATLGTKSDTAALTVTDATLTKIALTPAEPAIARNTTLALTATGTFSDNSTKDVTALATWTTSAPAIATVSNAAGSDGLVSGLTAGTATITAALSGLAETVAVRIKDVSLSSVAITPNPAGPLAVGSKLQFKVTGTFSDQTRQDLTALATWSSSLEAVATVGDGGGQDGLATAKAKGTTTIRAAFGAALSNRSATVSLEVVDALLTKITVSPATVTIAQGTTIAFTATGSYSDGVDRPITADVTWSSTNTTVASVSNTTGSDGIATGKTSGTSTIRATLGNQTGSATLTVSTATLSSIVVEPASVSLALGRTRVLKATGTFSDTTKQDLTAQVSWTSSDNTIATVSGAAGRQGTVTAVKASATPVTIVATMGNRSGECAVTVTAKEADHITVTAAANKIAKGTVAALEATMVYSDNSTEVITNTATWTSETPANVTVTSTGDAGRGRVTGVAVGTSIIRATKGGLTGPLTITVSDTTLKTNGLAIRPLNPSVHVDQTLALSVIGTFADNSTQDLTLQAVWASSDATKASMSAVVGSEGQVKGVALTTAPHVTITATTLTQTATAVLIVN
jgi:uncharacterized protein YjdB